jgi:hypothetical protein
MLMKFVHPNWQKKFKRFLKMVLLHMQCAGRISFKGNGSGIADGILTIK